MLHVRISATGIDAEDINYIEIRRCSYTSCNRRPETGGDFDLVPPIGFERDREAELVITDGNFFWKDDQQLRRSHL